jgi:hypothetical protein
MNVSVHEVGSYNLERAIKLLAGVPQGISKAVSVALKRAGAKAKTEAGTYAAREYTLSKSEFMKRVEVRTDIRESGGSMISMCINFRGAVIPLIMFQVRYGKGSIIHAQVKRSGGGEIHSAFAARIYGPIRIFERVGKARLPVEQKFGPSGAQMMSNDDIVEDMTKTIQETFDERLEHEVWRLLSGTGG